MNEALPPDSATEIVAQCLVGGCQVPPGEGLLTGQLTLQDLANVADMKDLANVADMKELSARSRALKPDCGGLAHYSLGQALAHTGRKQEAAREFQLANVDDPSLKPPKN